MLLQIDMPDAQVNEWPDGSVEILGPKGHIYVKGEYAKTIWAEYNKFLKCYPNVAILKIVLNVELPQPVGKWEDQG